MSVGHSCSCEATGASLPEERAAQRSGPNPAERPPKCPKDTLTKTTAHNQASHLVLLVPGAWR
jgi:hypothetical protein